MWGEFRSGVPLGSIICPWCVGTLDAPSYDNMKTSASWCLRSEASEPPPKPRAGLADGQVAAVSGPGWRGVGEGSPVHADVP